MLGCLHVRTSSARDLCVACFYFNILDREILRGIDRFFDCFDRNDYIWNDKKSKRVESEQFFIREKITMKCDRKKMKIIIK